MTTASEHAPIERLPQETFERIASGSGPRDLTTLMSSSPALHSLGAYTMHDLSLRTFDQRVYDLFSHSLALSSALSMRGLGPMTKYRLSGALRLRHLSPASTARLLDLLQALLLPVKKLELSPAWSSLERDISSSLPLLLAHPGLQGKSSPPPPALYMLILVPTGRVSRRFHRGGRSVVGQ